MAAQCRWTVLAPTLLAAALAAVYMIWAPSSQDLAAATFRADLFADHGLVIWNNAWYSGHHVLSYSVLYPPLGALLGPRLVGALAVVAAAALFALLARRWFGARALIPSLWFAAAIGSWLLTGRIPFLLAVPFGLGALLAGDSGRSVVGGVLAALASLASPVAGLFIAVAGVAIALTGERLRGAALALGGAAPIAVLNLAFPVPGQEPFVFSAFVAIPILAAAVLWLVPPEYRALRIGAVLYALLALVVYVVPNALGGNVTRLGALFAGPVLALVLWPRGRLLVLVVSVAAAVLAARRPGPRRPQGRRRRLDRARLLRAAARRARPALSCRRSLPGRDPADQEPLRGRLRRPPVPDRPRLAAPARVRRLRPVHRRSPRRRRLPRLASRPRGQLRRRPRGAPRLPRRGRGGADRLRARLPGPGLERRRLAPVPGRRLARMGSRRPRGRRDRRRRVHGRRGARRTATDLDPLDAAVERHRGRGLRQRGRRTARPWSSRGRGAEPITIETKLGGESCSG